MTIQEVPRQEVPSSAELSDIPVSYDVYRSVCDARANNFRLTGIVSEEGYESALQDPLTQYVSIAGVRYPYLTPMRHVEGYDEEKTARLTGKPKVFVLALPPRMLAEEGVDGAQFPALADDEVVLVESGWQDYQNDMQVAPQLFGGQAVEILDTRLEGSEDQPAAMSLYTGRFIQTDPTVSTEAPKTFGEVFDQNRGDNEYILGQNGSRVVLYEGKDLTQNSEVLEQIWAICEDRFDEMGEMHPVSMEESKEFFVQMLKNESVGAIVERAV